jgi:hypothetical protein
VNYRPHRPQGPIVIAYYFQIATSLALWILYQEGAQGEFELSHVTCQLQLPALSQGLGDRNMKHERPYRETYNRNHPMMKERAYLNFTAF